MPKNAELQATMQGLVDRAADHFSASLRAFKPWTVQNAITERNLSFQLATAFLRHFPDGFAFMEVPFTFKDRKRADTHLDAYLFSKPLEILLESKVVWAKDHIDSIVADMERMSPQVLVQIQKRHRETGASQARSTVAMILAETWRSENAEWWCGAAAKKPRWSRDLLPTEGWKYDSKMVFKEHDGPEGSLHWLWAYKTLLV
jgi:hypothetical protein